MAANVIFSSAYDIVSCSVAEQWTKSQIYLYLVKVLIESNK